MFLNIAFESYLQKVISNHFFNDYKKTGWRFSLEFLQQCLLAQRFRPGDVLHRHLKDVKNDHNTLLQLILFFTSISFKVTLS